MDALAALVPAAISIAAYFNFRVELRQHLEQLRALVNRVPDGVLITSTGGEIEFASSSLLELSGYAAEDLVGRPIGELVPSFARDAAVPVASAAAGESRVPEIGGTRESVLHRKDGRGVPVEISAGSVRWNGSTRAISIVRDVRRERGQAGKRALSGLCDPLTSLPNRVYFQFNLQQQLRTAESRRSRLAVLSIDLDGFEAILDSSGNGVGDAVLKAAAERMVASLRSTDGMSRAIDPGDGALPGSRRRCGEFAAVIAGIRRPRDAASVAERLATRLAEPIRVAERELRVGASIGIALYPEDGADAETLVVRAEAAMHQAKQAGGGGYRFHGSEIEHGMMRRRRIAARLADALAAGTLDLYYQPITRADTGTIVGAEALLRWRDEELGVVGTSELVSVAEGTDLILRLDGWALRSVCREIRAWKDAGLRVPPISLNVSARQLRSAHFAQSVRDALAAERLEPRDLQLEVHETALSPRSEVVDRVLSSLLQDGVGVVLDGFDAGESSLSEVASLPISGLKIHRGMLESALENERTAAVVSCLSSLAKKLGLALTAQGVEQPQQLRLLIENGCPQFQGYLFSPALPGGSFARMLAARGGATDAA